MRRLTWGDVSARRLARNHLVEPCADGLDRIAADMVGVHAQVMSAATLSLGLRTAGPSVAGASAGVADAIAVHRTLVKTRGPRGTVHLLAARDLPMWTGALSTLPVRHPEWSAAQIDQVVAAIADAVAEAPLTVDELTDAVVARVGGWAGERTMDAFQDKWPAWRSLEAVATARGAICYGPVRGRRATYVAPPAGPPMPGTHAMKALVKTFLHAYGPATVAQIERWLGARPPVLPPVEVVDFDGVEALVNEGDVDGAAMPATPHVRLLPYFDSYVIGTHPRTTLFPGRAAERALNRGQAGNYPVVLVDGTVAGVWHATRTAVAVELLTTPAKRLRGSIEAEAARIGLKQPVIFGEVTAGPHA